MEQWERDEVIKLLEPILKGAKVRENHTQKPYKHTYITLKKGRKDE